jgi:uncharacterized membrane protein
MAWIVHRAQVQAITLDEAHTFLHWVHPEGPTQWLPHSNNHVLNSALMKVSAFLFGISPLALRVPALLGGLIYICASVSICWQVARSGLGRNLMFVCLVFNPFVMDYLVVARGYGLSIGFLAVVQAVLIRVVMDGGSVRLGVLASLAAGLAFCANFASAFAVGLHMVAVVVLLLRGGGQGRREDWWLPRWCRGF